MPSYLNLPGGSGNYASTPDADALDVTGDIEIVVRMSMADWSPTAQNTIVGKWNSTGSQNGYLFRTQTSGGLQFNWSTTGGNSLSVASTITTPFANDEVRWVKVTRSSTSGDVFFYYAADQSTEPSSWTTLGAVRTSTPSGIFANTVALELGSFASGTTQPATGKMYRAIVRSGIGGTAVFDADFTDLANGTTSFAEDANGATVTINGTASIIATDDGGSSHSSGGRRPRKPTKEELAIIKAAQRRPVLQQLIDKRQPVTHVAGGMASFGFDATAVGVVSWSSADDDEQLLAVF